MAQYKAKMDYQAERPDGVLAYTKGQVYEVDDATLAYLAVDCPDLFGDKPEGAKGGKAATKAVTSDDKPRTRKDRVADGAGEGAMTRDDVAFTKDAE